MEHVDAAGASIPALGLGTFQLSGAECRQTVETALELGYRHIDTAQRYDNERAVGEAIDAAPVDREDVFLTTKVWRSNLRPDDVRAAATASIDRLGVDSVDLLLAHWPHPRVPVAETLEAMAALREEGLTRHVGVSNFTRSQLSEAMAVSDAPLVTDQVLYHPFVDQEGLREFCGASGVALTAYSPLARGTVTDSDALAAIGGRYDKTAAQVALRWLVQQDGVVAIPRSSGREHLAENIDIFDFELTDAEMERVGNLSPGPWMRLRNTIPSLVRALPL
jgi:diketogulonate reductase-like aldo/keto reductase